MKIFDKFPNPSHQYRETVLDRSKRNLASELNKKENELKNSSNLAELNEATLYFSRNQTNEKVNGVEEAFKLLKTVTEYLENPTQKGEVIELTKDMHFDTKKITAIFSS